MSKTDEAAKILAKEAKAHIKLVQKAIDALIDLEGVVYPNGLTSHMHGALGDLRSKESTLNFRIEQAA